MTPGCTRARRASGSIAAIARMCRERSSTSPGATHCPARLVPPPRARTGTPRRAHDRDGGGDVVRVAGQADAERLDRVRARVLRVEVAAVGVEADLALDVALERGLELARVGDPGGGRARRRAHPAAPAAARARRAVAARWSIAACTPPGRIGTPAPVSPISTPAQRAREPHVVEVAEVADAEDPARRAGRGPAPSDTS